MAEQRVSFRFFYLPQTGNLHMELMVLQDDGKASSVATFVSKEDAVHIYNMVLNELRRFAEHPEGLPKNLVITAPSGEREGGMG